MAHVTHQEVSVLEADPVFRLLQARLERRRLEQIEALAYGSHNNDRDREQSRGWLQAIDWVLGIPNELRKELEAQGKTK